jgi:hypothetical protein
MVGASTRDKKGGVSLRAGPAADAVIASVLTLCANWIAVPGPWRTLLMQLAVLAWSQENAPVERPNPARSTIRPFGVQRVEQIERQMHRRLARARPRKGVWLPQIAIADQTHWPEGCTQRGIEAIRSAFSRQETMTEES